MSIPSIAVRLYRSFRTGPPRESSLQDLHQTNTTLAPCNLLCRLLLAPLDAQRMQLCMRLAAHLHISPPSPHQLVGGNERPRLPPKPAGTCSRWPRQCYSPGQHSSHTSSGASNSVLMDNAACAGDPVWGFNPPLTHTDPKVQGGKEHR